MPKKKQKTLRRGVTPEMAENSLSFLDTIAPVFDGIPAEDWEAYCLPVLAELFVEELKEGIPALSDGVPDHLDALLRPGSIVWSLWEALNTRFPSWYREAALAEIKKKLYLLEGERPHDPLHWIKKKKGIPQKIEKTLREEHPDLSYHAALELRVLQALYHASEKVLTLLPKKPMDSEGVFRRLKNTMSDNAIPEEILGDDWKNSLPEETDPLPPILNVPELQPLTAADAEQLSRFLVDRAGLTPMEREVFLLVLKQEATSKEAAGILGISEGAVRLRLHKARKKIKGAALGEI